jgi:hypothetical protein
MAPTKASSVEEVAIRVRLRRTGTPSACFGQGGTRDAHRFFEILGEVKPEVHGEPDGCSPNTHMEPLFGCPVILWARRNFLDPQITGNTEVRSISRKYGGRGLLRPDAGALK